MKPNSYVFAILLTLCATALSAQAQNLEFYLYNSSKIRLIENQLQYQITPIKNGSHFHLRSFLPGEPTQF